MATTPIYNWPTPDNTDLVKNGALSIRTLGNSIDTTMGTMTPKTLVDAKGDLIAATANDTPARLAVGNNGETLVADSSTSTGLRYQAPVNVNPVLNSAFQVWQRNTSGSATTGLGSYVADRWSGLLIGGTQTNTISRQGTNDSTNLPFIQYCARYQRTSGQTSTGTMYLTQSFESINSIPYAGKTVTLSFYARAGANFSATSNVLTVNLASGTGTDQNLNGGFTGYGLPINSTATLTTTWQRFTYTGSVGSLATQLGLAIFYNPTGTAGANDWFEITGVQLEVGSVATPFKTYAGTIQGELSACQRYYVRSGLGNGFGFIGSQGFINSTTAAFHFYPLPVPMRVKPSSVDFGGTLGVKDTSNVTTTVSNIALSGDSSTSVGQIDITSSGMTSARCSWLVQSNSATAYIGFSAEL